ncbi:MAG: cytochrome c5 family protein [Burkholderiaceae bacterium]|nr:cytochrome c5 family protein [Burkholderiaceae bacterium]
MLKTVPVVLALLIGVGLSATAVASPNPIGEKLYRSSCMVCHTTGAANAPKLGNKAAWAPLIELGMDSMLDVAIKGKGAMPPRGGAMKADDEAIRAAIEYMVSKSQ